MKQNKRALFALPLMFVCMSLPAMAATPWDGLFTGIFDSFTTGGVINVALLTLALVFTAWGVMQGMHGEDRTIWNKTTLGGLMLGAVGTFVTWFQA